MTEQIRPNYYRVTVMDAHGETVPVECFGLIDALGLDFYTGNALKYLWRAGKKTPETIEDLKKARTYLDVAIAKSGTGST